jgi:hypothetical protein
MTLAVDKEYRKGKLPLLKRDFEDCCAAQIRNADFFVTELDDLYELVHEYEELLTRAEMQAAFKRAMRAEGKA